MRSFIDALAGLIESERSPNVVATARVGSRVIRCVGAAGFHSQLEVAGQLDCVLEHIRQQARLPRPAEEVKKRVFFAL